MIEKWLTELDAISLPVLFMIFYMENLLIAIVAVVLGFWWDGNNQLNKLAGSGKELAWTFCTVFFNSVVTMLGYLLYREGIVQFDFSANFVHWLLDFVLLVVLMDLLMYVFHFLIHKFPVLYKFHDLHHHYPAPTAISLFVLHPVEVVGFGMLLLLLLCVFTFSFYATLLYLAFNVAMGIAGHVQKEVVPVRIKQNRYLKWLATTSFHRDHHAQEAHNFGFYTSIWDRILGTWTDSSVNQN